MGRQVLNITDPYSILAKHYDLLMGNWDQQVTRTGEWLDDILRPLQVHSILDCTCGTGLQSIALAKRGYFVTGVDISPAMLRKARENARRAGVAVRWIRSDIRSLQNDIKECFDAVITCGNSLLHLSNELDLCRGIRSMCVATHLDGYCLIDLAEYEENLKAQPPFLCQQVQESRGRQAIFFATKERRGRIVTLNIFVLRETKRGWRTIQRSSQLRPPQKSELLGLLKETGFQEIRDISRPRSITLLAKKVR
jgi:SAM-dependent methyltransferase